MWTKAVLLVCFSSFHTPSSASPTSSPHDSPTSLFSSYWSWRLERSPEFATMTGDRRHNSRLESFTRVRWHQQLNK